METALWILTGILAFVFLVSGLTKMFQPKRRLRDTGMTYVENVPGGVLKLLGLLEVLGALGLVLPALFGTHTVLVPVSALALALLMVSAVVVHLRRGEPPVAALVLAAATLGLGLLRLGAYPL